MLLLQNIITTEQHEPHRTEPFFHSGRLLIGTDALYSPVVFIDIGICLGVIIIICNCWLV